MSIKTAEIITIGDEIMIGQITDTNTQFLSAELNKLGIQVIRKSSIGDIKSDIINLLNESFSRADLVVTTGGLGPTKDDITKHTICEYFNSKLIIHEPTLERLRLFFEKRGRELSETNKQQAYVPEICQVIENFNGTAPCMWIEKDHKILVCLPGVPYEMKALVLGGVSEKLKHKLSHQKIYHKTILTAGIGESMLSDLIATWEAQLPQHIKLAYLPSYGSVRLRLSAIGSDTTQLELEVTNHFNNVYSLIDEYIVSKQVDTIEEAIGELLLKRGLSITTAESCTGGGIAAQIVSVSGSSQYFKGSVVAYSNEIKIRVLGVEEQTLQKFGAVSEECVMEMAQNLTKFMKSDIGIAVSGIAGPAGGSTEKPVGTIWLACSNGNKTITKRLLGTSIREANIKLATNQALYLAWKFISETNSLQ